jgi:hypothetical protein
MSWGQSSDVPGTFFSVTPYPTTAIFPVTLKLFNFVANTTTAAMAVVAFEGSREGMMPDAKQLDLTPGVSDGPPSRVLRLGKDEMNLAEFPITLLTDRVPKGQKTIQYQDQIFDDRLGRPVTRKLTVSADEAYGLPTAVDDDVILALIQLTKLANDFTSREVQFNRLDLIKLPRSDAAGSRKTPRSGPSRSGTKPIGNR